MTTVVTTGLVKQIRYFRSIGLSQIKTAKLLNVHRSTVEKYESDERMAAWRRKERARHDRERKDPAVLERKREAAREHARRTRCAGQ